MNTFLHITVALGLIAAAPNVLRAGTAEPADAARTDPVLARGKQFEVKRSQLAEAWAIYRAKVARGGQLPDDPREAVEAKLLSHIIDTEILLQKASPDDQRQAVDAVEKLLADSRKRFATEAEFKDWLQHLGMSPEQYRRRMIEQNACERVIDRELKPSIHISDEAVKKYYDENAAAFERPAQVRARQIWLGTSDPATHQPIPEAARREKARLARDLKARLDRGEDFFKLYRQFSEEPWAREEKAGDELLYVKGQMPPEFDAAAFALRPSEISPVIETSLGYHIVRVSEVQPAGRLPLAEVAPRLRDFLVEEEVKKRLPEYLRRLKAEAGVEILALDAAR